MSSQLERIIHRGTSKIQKNSDLRDGYPNVITFLIMHSMDSVEDLGHALANTWQSWWQR